MSDHPNTSVYFTEQDREVVRELMEATGLKRTPLIREALYEKRDRVLTESAPSRRAELLEIAERIKRLA